MYGAGVIFENFTEFYIFKPIFTASVYSRPINASVYALDPLGALKRAFIHPEGSVYAILDLI
jgi:hypothetical protein